MKPTEKEVFDQVAAILSDVLDIPTEAITRETSPDTTDSWDSIRHLNVVMAIEEEFSIVLTPEEQIEMLSAGLIADLLLDKLS